MSAAAGDDEQSVLQSLMGDLTSSIPGIDEAMSFSELMKQVQTMDYDTIVFDTAPTGHTLRLLSFPTIMEKALGKIMDLKDKFGGMLSSMSGLMGGGAGTGPNGESPTDMMLGKLEEVRTCSNEYLGARQPILYSNSPLRSSARSHRITDPRDHQQSKHHVPGPNSHHPRVRLHP